jgi:Transposase DDE domain
VIVLHGAALASHPWTRFALPFKHHAEHRRHIPKPRYRVTTSADYDASLRRRGSLTMRVVFGLALRQTEGLIGSVTGLLGHDLAVPDQTTIEQGRWREH